ncbi:MAG TPA: hypothetical protein DCG75_10420 [Bacteroidales bacterium]|jgi:L,D-transpeptidase YbiS|nr:hypothetical protein [Bacteroidales bacterium]
MNNLAKLKQAFKSIRVKSLIDYIKYNKQIQLFGKISSVVIIIVCLFLFTILLQKILISIKFHEKVLAIDQQDELLKAQNGLEKELKALDKKLASKTPRSYYLVINSASNEFTLHKGTQTIKKDKCSTGSYILLKNGDQQQWMFKTPKGEFRIQGKTTSPVWKKPDWAFVEEGIPVPSANHFSRFEYGVLGDYALNLGQGYLIHGTLYQRFLGLPVTHGCIRLNDENLELIYNSLSVGSKVYIY